MVDFIVMDRTFESIIRLIAEQLRDPARSYGQGIMLTEHLGY